MPSSRDNSTISTMHSALYKQRKPLSSVVKSNAALHRALQPVFVGGVENTEEMGSLCGLHDGDLSNQT